MTKLRRDAEAASVFNKSQEIRSNKTTRSRRTNRLRLGRFEQLEQRTLMAAKFLEFVDPHSVSGNQFGHSVVPLSTGNVVITAPFDDAGGTDAGAVYLFNGATGALISTLIGSHANDKIALDGVTPLSNGNFVIRSSLWDNGALADAGAVTWGSGTSGISGVVSSTNSLVGSKANDQVGSGGIRALGGGSYVVNSPIWDNSAVVDAGAVTFGSGTSGIAGAISASNSLVGSATTDSLGSGGVVALDNGNYVVLSPVWNNGATIDAGAVTWGSGISGVVGSLSAANSLVGSTASDQVGISGVVALTGGNYVVVSPLWDAAGAANAGAVTWGSGTAGVKGAVTSTNSLVGSTAGDQVGTGAGAVVALTNGSYVVSSPLWNNAAVVDAGAATWGSGSTGIAGTISAANSLVGTTASDSISGPGITVLSNGNYVVRSPQWDNGATSNVGAVTWGSGTVGVKGAVTATNSLFGSTLGDQVGSTTVVALTNGHYVVPSPFWNSGAIVDVGAATWGNGTTGRIGAVSSSNSLVGSTANDSVGSSGVTPLTNGNYVVNSPSWNTTTGLLVGAATWGNGASGTTGTVSSANSLVGSTAGDQVASGRSVALNNGNYVVRSTSWTNGSIANAGAVTWGSGTTGVKGTVSSTNSLVGSSTNDSVSEVFALSNGNYVVRATVWNNGAVADVGAVTWGNGTSGVKGTISTSNSLIGSTASDTMGTQLLTFSNGNYAFGSSNYDDASLTNSGAMTWGSGTIGAKGTITATNSARGTTLNTGMSNLVADNVNSTFMVSFLSEANGKVRVGSQTSGYVNAPASVSFQNQIAPLSQVTSTASAIKVADVVISDDALGTNTLSLSGTDSASFQLVGNALFLKAGVVLNSFLHPTFSVSVNVDDTSIAGSPDSSSIYTLTLDAAPLVINSSFFDTGTLPGSSTSMTVTFSETVTGANVASNYELRRSGTDGQLGTADDVIVPITSASFSGTKATLNFAALVSEKHRLTILDTIKDSANSSLDGNNDGLVGGNWQRDFEVGTVLSTGVPLLLQSIAPPNTASSTPNGNFGNAVAANSAYYLVGARGMTIDGFFGIGQGFLFSSATGQLLQTFNNPSPSDTDQMGNSVAITGETAVLGAPFDTVGAVQAGRVMIFRASSGQPVITIDNPTPADTELFGYNVAASGDWIAVSAELESSLATSSGAVYLYNMAGVLQRTIFNPTPQSAGIFGKSIALDGNTLAVGATSAGTVYVYDVTTGTLLRTINNPDGSSFDAFGKSLALSGNKLAVGSSGAVVNGVRSGKVRLYDTSTGALLQSFTAPTPVLDDQFGGSMSMDATSIIIGAPGTDQSGSTDVGAAYFFNVSTGALIGAISNPTPNAIDKFGNAIARVGNRILMGVELDDTQANDQGYAYVFSAVQAFTLSLSSASLAENLAIGTTVGSLNASASANAPVSYALIAGAGGADNSKFTIVGNQLKSAAIFDYETQNSFSLLVEATDALGFKSRSNFSIAVNDVNEAPTQITLSNRAINEMLPVNSILGTLSTLDPDANSTFVYSLSSGGVNDNAMFQIVGSQLLTAQSFDYETKAQFLVEIISTDNGALQTIQQFEIVVNDLNGPIVTALPRYDLRIVADIDARIQSSSPESAIELGGISYFIASTPELGKELYRTDLTTAGTSVVKDLMDGSDSGSPYSLTLFGNKLYYLSSFSYVDLNQPPGGPTQTHFGLWKSDGTTAGTVLVHDFGLDPLLLTTNPKPMQVLGSKLLFFKGDSSNEQLWVSDGTDAGTVMLAAFAPAFGPLITTMPTATTSSLFYFNRNADSNSGTHELWRTDGTVAGTFAVRQQTQSSPPDIQPFDTNIVAIGNTVYFVSTTTTDGFELWKTNGTVGGTARVKDINAGFISGAPFSLSNLNGTLIFSANDGVSGRELWKSDGSAAGTVMLKDLFVGTSFDSGISTDNNFAQFTLFNNQLYFTATNGTVGYELWRTDGTAVGTQMVLDYGTGSDSLLPAKLISTPGKLLVVTSTFGQVPEQLWATDGTAVGTVPLLTTASLSPFTTFTNSGVKTFFSASDVTHGQELWVTDGTSSGTQFVKDFRTGSASGAGSILTATASGVLLSVDDPTAGVELGFSDGTLAGSGVIDVARGTPGSNIRQVIAQGAKLFISTNAGLYTSLGDAATTTQIGTVLASSMTAVGSKVFFVAPTSPSNSDNELWVSDGTTNGTRLVFDVRPGTTSSSPDNLTSFNGGIYFVANDGSHGRELWRSFGAPLDPLNTTLFHEFVAGAADGQIDRLLVVNGKLYVVAGGKLYVENNNNFIELATTDGSSLMPWDDLLYFGGTTASTGTELWRTDGTLVNTVLVRDINPGPASSFPGGGVVAGSAPSVADGATLESRLVFRALIADGTSQLFATNGTTAGTQALTNSPMVTTGNGASLTPVSLTQVKNRVYFEAYSPEAGRELWITDGTVVGTHLVKDMRAGTAPDPTQSPDLQFPSYFNIKSLTALGDKLFFSIPTVTEGMELWTSDGTATGTNVASDILTGNRSGSPRNFLVVGNTLYFSADTDQYGVGSPGTSGELFRLNEAPYVFPQSGATVTGQSRQFNLRGLDRNGDSLTYSIVTAPAHGTWTLSGSLMVYTPASGYVGPDQYTYRAFDGSAFSDPATVDIAVLASGAQSISFELAGQTVSESAGFVVVKVVLSQPASDVVQIPFSYGFGNSRAEDIVAIAPGATSGNIVVSIARDNTDTLLDRQLEITLLPDVILPIGAISQHVVTLTDVDSQPQVTFIDPQKTYTESDGIVSFEVGLTNASDRVVTTSINNTLFGTGVDYNTVHNQLVFQPGQVRQRVLVSLVNDTLPEPRETIVAGIASVSGATVIPDPNRFRSIAWLEDDDISTINISPENSLPIEGETVTLKATRSRGDLSVALNVPVTIFARGASAADYTLSSTSFQFTPNATEATITLTTIQDNLAEGFEAVSFTLASSASYQLGDRSEANVGIYDGDSISASLSIGSIMAPRVVRLREDAGQVQVTARLSTASNQTISLPVVINSGTQKGYATVGQDFNFSIADFVFPPGTTEVTRTLTILDNDVAEPDEKIKIALKIPPTLLQSLDSEQLSQEILLLNDDYTYEISAPASVNENASYNVNVTISPAPSVNKNVSINVSTSLKDSEFRVNGSLGLKSLGLNFDVGGPTTKNIPVSLIDDTEPEKTEQLTFRVGLTAAATTTDILDNEKRVLSLAAPASGLRLTTGNTIYIPIRLNSLALTKTKIMLTFSGTAKQGTDYFLNGSTGAGSVVIDAGSDITYATILPIDNGVADGDKTLIATIQSVDDSNTTVSRNAGTVQVIIPDTKPAAAPPREKPLAHAAIPAGTIINFFEEGDTVPITGKSPLAKKVDLSSSSIPCQYAGTSCVAITTTGLIEGGRVFFDSNFNGIRDILDLNRDGRQDAGEPLEPEFLTEADGSFGYQIPSDFDVNSDNIIENTEGRFVSTGGVDRSTNLPVTMQLATPFGIDAITPLSTLAENILRRYSMSIVGASDKVNQAFALGNFDLAAGESVYQVLANDSAAGLAYNRQVVLSSTVLLMASLLDGRSSAGRQQTFDQVFDRLADSAVSGAKLDLTSPVLIGNLLNSLNQQLLNPLSATIIDGAVQLISLGADRVQSTRLFDFSTPIDYLNKLTKVKRLLQGDLADQLRSVGAGTLSITTLLAQYTNGTAPNFDSLAAAQTIGQVIPSVIQASDGLVREGQSGSKFMEFKVGLAIDHAGPVSVNYATVDGSATSLDNDYTPVSGTLTWASGDTTLKTIQVPITGDSAFEVDEYFSLILSAASQAVIRTPQAYGFIVNDDVVTMTAGPTDSTMQVVHDTTDTIFLHDNSIFYDGELTDPVQATMVGRATSPTDFSVDYSTDTYRGDSYTMQGGSASDQFTILGGRFQSIAYIVSSAASGQVLVNPENTGPQSKIQLNSMESVVFQTSSLNELIVQLPASVSGVIVEDADTGSTGTMRLRSSTSQFAPILFNVPATKITIITLNSSASLTTASTDPSFMGTIVQVFGGVTLSASIVNENLSSGATVGVFNTLNPLLTSYALTLTSGTGDTDNGSFSIAADGHSLLTTASFNYESKSQYTIRVLTTGVNGFALEQNALVLVRDLPELVAPVQFGDGTIQHSVIKQLVLTFDGTLTINAGAFTLQKRGGNQVTTSFAAPLVNGAGQTVVTLTFSGANTRGISGILDDGYYQLTVDGTKILRGGVGLDVNQDGQGGDTLNLGAVEADNFFALYGDTSGDGVVGIAEFGSFRSAFGKTSSDAGYNALFDYEGDRAVGISDFGQFRARFGKPKLSFS